MVDFSANAGKNIMEQPTDVQSGGIRTIATIHSKVHEGKSFVACDLVEDLANEALHYILIKTGDDILHFEAVASFGGDGVVIMYEGATVSADGTEITVFNRNHNSSNTCDVEIFHTPTITDNGTAFATSFIAGGSGPFSSGGSDGTRQEHILKANTNYLISVENRSGSAEDGSFCLDFYI